MLDASTIENLRLALASLNAPDSCGAWSAVGTLGRLASSGHDVVIDLAASSELGATVILATRRSDTAMLLPLTPRQRDVARRIIGGASNKAIARDLGLSVGTVKDHVHAILVALGFASRAELISSALRQS